MNNIVRFKIRTKLLAAFIIIILLFVCSSFIGIGLQKVDARIHTSTANWIASVIAIVVSVFIAFYLSSSMTKSIRQIRDAAMQIADGNLSIQELTSTSKDELADLTVAINAMVQTLRSFVRQVGSNSEQVAAAAEQLTASAEQSNQATDQIASAMREIATGSSKQVQSLEENASTMNELSSGIQHIALSAQEAATSAIQASELAQTGDEHIRLAVGKMNAIRATVTDLAKVIQGLGERSNEVGQIVEAITKIASQTNLLALNAAIEAARAGEQGRGFAVVANEVRKLAEQSADSAGQIAELVAGIQEETAVAVRTMEKSTHEVVEGTQTMGSVGNSFGEIQRAVGVVAGQVQEVSAAVEQMTAGVEQAVHSISVISHVSEQAAASAESVSETTSEQLASMQEMTSSATALSTLAEELLHGVNQFTV